MKEERWEMKENSWKKITCLRFHLSSLLFHLLLQTLFVRNRQLVTTFGTACSQYSTAVLRTHTSTESVLIGTFATRWLESPFHCILLLLRTGSFKKWGKCKGIFGNDQMKVEKFKVEMLKWSLKVHFNPSTPLRLRSVIGCQTKPRHQLYSHNVFLLLFDHFIYCGNESFRKIVCVILQFFA